MENKDWREVQRLLAWYVLTPASKEELDKHLDMLLKMLMKAKIEKNETTKKQRQKN